MLDVQPLILEELHRLAPADDVGAATWEDVLRRASPGTRRPRYGLIAAAAAALLVIVWLAAPAFGVNPPFLDFFSTSKHVPKRLVTSFQVLNLTAPHGMSPHVLAGQTRRVTVYRLRDGSPFPLYVAPRKGGGFCFTFGYGGGCTDRNAAPHDERGDVNAREIGLGRLGSHIYAGTVYDQRIDHLELRLADGGHVDIPLLWVSPPIDAGFFLYDLTRPQRFAAHAPKALAAVDSDGRVLGVNRSMFAPQPAWFDPRKVSNPAQRHVVLRSGRSTVEIAPSRTGGDCWWLQHDGRTAGSGCAPPRYLTVPMAGGLNHGTRWTSFHAQVEADVARVELRFQDGTQVELLPVHGFVLYEIPTVHWARGSRLYLALAFDARGRRLARQTFDPRDAGVYG
jgi:hypothetical protein